MPALLEPIDCIKIEIAGKLGYTSLDQVDELTEEEVILIDDQRLNKSQIIELIGEERHIEILNKYK